MRLEREGYVQLPHTGVQQKHNTVKPLSSKEKIHLKNTTKDFNKSKCIKFSHQKRLAVGRMDKNTSNCNTVYKRLI